jgi:hypothetical protein
VNERTAVLYFYVTPPMFRVGNLSEQTLVFASEPIPQAVLRVVDHLTTHLRWTVSTQGFSFVRGQGRVDNGRGRPVHQHADRDWTMVPQPTDNLLQRAVRDFSHRRRQPTRYAIRGCGAVARHTATPLVL